ncbi:MAG: uroporphyrinogen decarboxylase [Deltaproteobacteria bacterium]|jgi:uroporphyrinogen decarboxylase|nr:uroporphyrinogen decarboxylase [Deltaproteobacteria bacterium]
MRRELIFKAFDRQPVSRVPLGFWFHFLPEAETSDWRENLRLAEKNAAGHQAFIRAFKPDMVKIMSDGFFFYPSAGIYQPVDLPMIKVLEPDSSWIKAQVSLVRRVRAMQEDAAYFYNIFSPVTSLRFKIGLGRLKIFAEAQPEALGKALDRMGQGLARLAAAVIAEGGADGIYLSVQNPDSTFFSQDFYQKHFAPSERAVLEAAAGAGGRNILHICGYAGVRNNLSSYAGYPAAAVNWAVNIEKVSLEQGRAIFQKPVLGGFDNTPDSVLVRGTKAEIKEQTRDIIRRAGPLGLIVGADCTLPEDISLEHLEWVREACSEAIRFGGSEVRNFLD